MITQERLKEILHYDPDTGVFTWKSRIGDPRKVNGFNTKYSGNPTGLICSQTKRCRVRIEGVLYLAHRLAFLYMTGSIPEFIDHKDNNPSNNKWFNLRSCDKTQNACNQSVRNDNKTGVKGVNWHRAIGKFNAQIQFKKKKYNLGYYDSLDEASDVVRVKREELHEDFHRHF